MPSPSCTSTSTSSRFGPKPATAGRPRWPSVAAPAIALPPPPRSSAGSSGSRPPAPSFRSSRTIPTGADLLLGPPFSARYATTPRPPPDGGLRVSPRTTLLLDARVLELADEPGRRLEHVARGVDVTERGRLGIQRSPFRLGDHPH